MSRNREDEVGNCFFCVCPKGSHETIQRQEVHGRFQPGSVDRLLKNLQFLERFHVVGNAAFHHVVLALLKGSFELRVGAILRRNLCKRALRIRRCRPCTTEALLQGRLLDSTLWHPDGSVAVPRNRLKAIKNKNEETK